MPQRSTKVSSVFLSATIPAEDPASVKASVNTFIQDQTDLYEAELESVLLPII